MSAVLRYTYFLIVLVLTTTIQWKLKTAPQTVGILLLGMVLILQRFGSEDVQPLTKGLFRLLLTLLNFIAVFQLADIVYHTRPASHPPVINGKVHAVMDMSAFLFVFIATLAAPLLTWLYNRLFTYDETAEKRFTLAMILVYSGVFLIGELS